jgi:hypothetical protein
MILTPFRQARWLSSVLVWIGSVLFSVSCSLTDPMAEDASLRDQRLFQFVDSQEVKTEAGQNDLASDKASMGDG